LAQKRSWEKTLHYADSRSPKHHRRTPSKRMLALGSLAPPSACCVICPTSVCGFVPHFLRGIMKENEGDQGNRAGSKRRNSQIFKISIYHCYNFYPLSDPLSISVMAGGG
jgi:hypothetical protein